MTCYTDMNSRLHKLIEELTGEERSLLEVVVDELINRRDAPGGVPTTSEIIRWSRGKKDTGRVGKESHYDSGEHSILELRGLGKEVWQGVDVTEYLKSERESWHG